MINFSFKDDKKKSTNSNDFTITLEACLSKFTSKEKLNDKIECEACTKNCNSQRNNLVTN